MNLLKKRSKGYRIIDINGEKWQWKAGSDRVSIRNPEGKSFAPLRRELLPNQYDDWDRSIITPGNVRTYIDSHCRSQKELNVDTVKLLQEIYHGKRYAEYAGGTLTIKSEETNDQLLMFNVGKGKNTKEECWICLNYIIHKSPEGAYWDKAVATLKKYPEFKRELTKAMLRSMTTERYSGDGGP